jgi:hypothetical protein
MALARQGRNAEAEQALLEAAEADPQYRSAYDNWLAARVALRRHAEERVFVQNR